MNSQKSGFWPFSFLNKNYFPRHSCISTTGLSCLSNPKSLVCSAFPFDYTSSSFMHMCISQELFMLCLVFNTPSCKSKAARHKAVKTPLPLQPSPHWLENLWPSPHPWDRSSEESAQAETRHLLVLRPVSFLSPVRHARHWGVIPLTAVLDTCSITWSCGHAFHLSTRAGPRKVYTSKFVTQIKGGARCWDSNIKPVSCKLLEQNSCR